MTLVEMLVVAAIISVLAGLLLPGFARARESGRKAVCLSNLRQIGLAFAMYANDWDGCFPNTGDPYLWMGRHWRWPLKPYLQLAAQRDPGAPDDPRRSVGNRPGVLICPSDPAARAKWDSTSYGYSAAFYHSPEHINSMTTDDLWRLNRFPCETQSEVNVAEPSRKVLVAEWLTNHDRVRVGWWDWRGWRTYLFVDGHARYLPASLLRAAVNGLPDPNLTRDGIEGADVP